MKKLMLVLTLLLVTACAPWVKTDGPFTSESKGFTVDPPQGWMRRNTDELLLITKDGLLLQRAIISRKSLSDEKQFPYTRKRVTDGMLPQELAEVVIDDYQSDPDHPLEAVEENVPETVAGKPAFRVRLVYSTKDGLRYRCLTYGFIAGSWFYEIVYVAPARHYFDRDLAAVQAMVKSFRLTKL
jgi:hypothetical protein